MDFLDTVSLTILLGALLVLAGIISSLAAMRFGAPLLLVFLLIGMLAGESGPGGIRFDDVRLAYAVGSVALALILFDGGLRTRMQTFRSVLAPSAMLATVGVLVTAAVTAAAARLFFDLTWTEALLLGAVVGSTDAAAVFFLMHARGLKLRPRVGATLEVESGTNDPFAVFLTVVLIQLLLARGVQTWDAVVLMLLEEAAIGAAIGYLGGHGAVLVLNRLALPQGLHAPFVAATALVVFALANLLHGSGFLAAYLAGLVIGNRAIRAHNAVIAFLDVATWLAQLAMFVLLGLLAWPDRLLQNLMPALAVAVALMVIARPAAVFLCLAPFRFSVREKLFISWVGLRGAVGIFLASFPLLVDLPKAQLFFDVAFVVVFVSLLVQGWSLAAAAHLFHVALPRVDAAPQRIELDLPGQLEQELVGYPVASNSPYLRRGLLPSWAKPMLFVREQRVMSPTEAERPREGDYVYLLAPPEKAQVLDRFFVDMPPAATPDPRLLGDFFVGGEATLGAIGEIYGITAPSDEEAATPLTELFAARLGRPPRTGDVVVIAPIALIAHAVADGRVTTVGLQLAAPDPQPRPAARRLRRAQRRLAALVRRR